MDESVPVVGEFSRLYPSEGLGEQEERWSRFIDLFKEKYQNKPPVFVARSPGRVNLIGEHIDYSLYEVLPMAIAADVLVGVSYPPYDNHTISIANVNSRKFKSHSIAIPGEGNIEIDASTHEWTNYFKAGLNGAINLLRQKKESFSPRSMQLLVDGTVPPGGGLSSSAAFVCASALAVLWANGIENISKKELVELAIVSERSVGVSSGGMDQAASVFSIKGDALSVTFFPQLHAEPIAFPKLDPPITFMIAQSFVAAEKHTTAPECYNLRVVECTLAAEVMASALSLKVAGDASPLNHSLRAVQTAYFDSSCEAPPPIEQLETMLSLISDVLPKMDGYTLHEIASLLSITPTALSERINAKFPIRTYRFMLAQRATHVFSEALRVLKFRCLLQSQPPLLGSELTTRLGALMNESQSSCRDFYECSCPELDQLCKIATRAGAHGSRLTGAGWGGCSVHLVPKGCVDEVRDAWKNEFYNILEPGISEERLREAVVVSEPGQGSMM